MPFTTSDRMKHVFGPIPLLDFEDYKRRLAQILREDLEAHKETVKWVDELRAAGASERFESVRYTLACEIGSILLTIAELEQRSLTDLILGTEKEKGPGGDQLSPESAGPRPPAKEGPP